MKFAIIECINGNYFIRSEGITVLENAIVQYHDRCKVLWSAQDVVTGMVKIVDEYLECVEGYREYIHHEQQEEPQE